MKQIVQSCLNVSAKRSRSHLSGMHADSDLTVQVALGDHVRAAGVHHPRRLQGLHKLPADSLVAVSSGHLLQSHDGNQVSKLT